MRAAAILLLLALFFKAIFIKLKLITLTNRAREIQRAAIGVVLHKERLPC